MIVVTLGLLCLIIRSTVAAPSGCAQLCQQLTPGLDTRVTANHETSLQDLTSQLDYSRPGNWTEHNDYRTDGGAGQVHEEHGQVVGDRSRVRYYQKNYSYGKGVNTGDFGNGLGSSQASDHAATRLLGTDDWSRHIVHQPAGAGNAQAYSEQGQYSQGPAQVHYYTKNYSSQYTSGVNAPADVASHTQSVIQSQLDQLSRDLHRQSEQNQQFTGYSTQNRDIPSSQGVVNEFQQSEERRKALIHVPLHQNTRIRIVGESQEPLQPLTGHENVQHSRGVHVWPESQRHSEERWSSSSGHRREYTVPQSSSQGEFNGQRVVHIHRGAVVSDAEPEAMNCRVDASHAPLRRYRRDIELSDDSQQTLGAFSQQSEDLTQQTDQFQGFQQQEPAQQQLGRRYGKYSQRPNDLTQQAHQFGRQQSRENAEVGHGYGYLHQTEDPTPEAGEFDAQRPSNGLELAQQTQDFSQQAGFELRPAPKPAARQFGSNRATSFDGIDEHASYTDQSSGVLSLEDQQQSTQVFSGPETNGRILQVYGGTGPYNADHRQNIFDNVRTNPSATLAPTFDGVESWNVRASSQDEGNIQRVSSVVVAGAPEHVTEFPALETTTPGFWKRVGKKITNAYEKTKEKVTEAFG